MTAKKKRPSGRVTPKGTKPASKEKKRRRGETPATPPPPAFRQTGKVNRERGRGSMPVTHNRGNR